MTTLLSVNLRGTATAADPQSIEHPLSITIPQFDAIGIGLVLPNLEAVLS